MCYLVAKHIDEVGSLALKTTHGKHFSELKRSIEEQVGYKKFNLSRSADPQLMENMNHIILLIRKRNSKNLL